MANNIVAYVGLANFEIILYLSRILQRLGRKVLVVDNSETMALTYSVPQIAGMNTYESVISNRRVDFTNMPVSETLALSYDDILVDCGRSIPKTSPEMFTRIVYVTDMFEYNIRQIAHINHYDDCTCGKELLVKDYVNAKITPEMIAERLNKGIPADKISYIYRDDYDYENCLNSHINHIFTLKLTRMLRDYLLEQIRYMCPSFTMKDIKAAYAKAKKGD